MCGGTLHWYKLLSPLTCIGHEIPNFNSLSWLYTASEYYITNTPRIQDLIRLCYDELTKL